jgi:predicted outer membrane protein
MKTTYLLVAVLFTVGLLSCGGTGSTTTDAEIAVDSTADTPPVTETSETSTSDLILYAYMNNELQAGMARAAQETAASQSIKDLGQELVTGNKEISAKLSELAEAAQVQLPGGLEVEQQTTLDSVRQLSPDAFDEVFIEMLVKKQSDNIDLLEDLAAQADNPIMRGLADDMIDIQQTQIEQIEAALDDM